VVVDSVLWSGKGTIFNAVAVDSGVRHRVVADHLVMPREPVSGEVWDIVGVIRHHLRYGDQVEASKATLLRPSGRLIVDAIARSPIFRGIGEVRATRLWEALEEELYALLDGGDPAPFVEILGEDLARTLVDGWAEMEAEASIYRWLDRHGVSAGLARSIMAVYGGDAIEALEDNPYRLLAFSTWNKVDALARSMGISTDDERRRVAAADAVVYQRLHFSHTICDERAFVALLKKTLGCDVAGAQEALQAALTAHGIIRVGQGIQGLGPASMEQFIAQRVAEMTSRRFDAVQGRLRVPVDVVRIADEFRRHEGINLNTEQLSAVEMAATESVCCIVGGAGVGKTTVLKAVHMAVERSGGAIVQMALAGRAALRMREATQRPAITIARFLKEVDEGRLTLDQSLTVVIDESSMVDLPTLYRVLRRMEPGCRLILVGDSAQLPPIGFGLCFHSLAKAASVPRVELTEIHRAAAETGIPQASVAIRDGSVPNLPAYGGLWPGVTFIDAAPGDVVGTILDVVNDLGGVSETQIIAATKAGKAGTRPINSMFHLLLTPGRLSNGGFAEGEPVIWTVNNYELGLMNGSLGTVISAVDPEVLIVDWGGVQISIPFEHWRDMEHAYAITCHKAQGSQFRRVIVPVLPSRLLDRTLLYTALTRAQQQVVLIGDRRAFEAAVVGPPNPSRRESGMQHHLVEAREEVNAAKKPVNVAASRGQFRNPPVAGISV